MLSPLTIRLFGPFEVHVRGVPLRRLRTRKGEWLLGLLVLRAGSEVDRGWLAGTLWPDSSEVRARRSLRMSLSDLRRALGPEVARLGSADTGCGRSGGASRVLRLDLSGAEVDVLAFDAAIARGQLPSLEQAVALYRGPLLEACAETWVLQERESREALFLGALEVLAADAVHRGELQVAERTLRRAVATDPLRESAQRALMEALIARGDPSAAALVYRELRLRLHRELNTLPAPETQALFERLRLRLPVLLVPGGAPLLRGGAPPGTASAASARQKLPGPLTRFIGRDRELGEVKQLLADNRLLTLTGPGGCGKTRLALRVAADLLERFPDGVVWVDLASLADPGLVLQAIGTSLGVRDQAGRSLIRSIEEHLGTRSLLLVLDNCEHLLDACAETVAALLRHCPLLRVLTTSRERLAIGGEQVYSVPSLSLPGQEGALCLEVAWQAEAVRLFADRAVLVRPDFALTETTVPAIAHVCRRLEGMPLAIELAAARVNVLPVAQIAERLDDQLQLLTRGGRTAASRHQTLRACMGWSWSLLSESEQALLRRLSIFAGGWRLEAAEAVCGDDQCSTLNAQRSTADEGSLASLSSFERRDLSVGRSSFVIGRHEVLELLAALVDKSLVVYEDRAGGGRFRLLETVRHYARERLEEAGEAEALRCCHRDYYASWTGEVQSALSSTEQVRELDQERDNLRHALDGTIHRGEAGPTLKLAGVVGQYLKLRGHYTEGRQWLARALFLAPPTSPEAVRDRASISLQAGNIARLQTDLHEARRLLNESLAVGRTLNDPGLIIHSLNGLGGVAFLESDFSTARVLWEEELAVARRLDDAWEIAYALGDLAVGAMMQGHLARAGALLEESLGVYPPEGDRTIRAFYVIKQGQVAYFAGELVAARDRIEEGLTTIRANPVFVRHLGMAHLYLGQVALAEGALEEAEERLTEAISIQREAGDREHVGYTLVPLGALAQIRGEWCSARRCFSEALSIFSDTGLRWGIAWTIEHMASLALSEGQAGRASRLMGAAAALREAIDAAIHPVERCQREQDRADACAALGEAAFAAAWAEGQAMLQDEMVAYALEDSE